MSVGKYLPLVKQFYDRSNQTFTYLLICPKTKHSILINPVWTSDCLFQTQLFAIQNDLSIKYSINTPLNCVPYLSTISSKFERLYVQPDLNTSTTTNPYSFGRSWMRNLGGFQMTDRTSIPKQGEKIVCGSVALQVTNNVIKLESNDSQYSFNGWQSLHKDFVFIESSLIESTLMKLNHASLQSDSDDSSTDTNSRESNDLDQNERNLLDGCLPSSCQVYPAYGKDPNQGRSTVGFEKQTLALFQFLREDSTDESIDDTPNSK